MKYAVHDLASTRGGRCRRRAAAGERQQSGQWKCVAANIPGCQHCSNMRAPATEGNATMRNGHRHPNVGPANPAMPCPRASPTPASKRERSVAQVCLPTSRADAPVLSCTMLETPARLDAEYTSPSMLNSTGRTPAPRELCRAVMHASKGSRSQYLTSQCNARQ